MLDFSEKFLILCKNSLSRCCMIQAKPVQVHDTWSSETDVTTRNHHNLNPNKYPVPSQISPRGPQHQTGSGHCVALVFMIESAGRGVRGGHNSVILFMILSVICIHPRLCQSPFLLADIQCAVCVRPLSESEYHHSNCYRQLPPCPPLIVSHRSERHRFSWVELWKLKHAWSNSFSITTQTLCTGRGWILMLSIYPEFPAPWLASSWPLLMVSSLQGGLLSRNWRESGISGECSASFCVTLDVKAAVVVTWPPVHRCLAYSVMLHYICITQHYRTREGSSPHSSEPQHPTLHPTQSWLETCNLWRFRG